MKEVAGGQSRHFLSAIGGGVVALSADQTEMLEAAQAVMNAAGITPEIQTALGSVLVLVAVAWSWWAKRKRPA